MDVVWILVKATPEGACVLSGRDRRPMFFREPLLPHKLCEGFRNTGANVVACEVDLDAEEVILPREIFPENWFDNFGLSRDEENRVAAALAGRSAENDPAKIGGMGVRP